MVVAGNARSYCVLETFAISIALLTSTCRGKYRYRTYSVIDPVMMYPDCGSKWPKSMRVAGIKG